MIKLIDATLTMLDDCKLSKAQVQKLISLLKELSITDVVLSPKIYHMLCGDFPEDITYYLEDGTMFGEEGKGEAVSTPEISFHIQRHAFPVRADAIQNIQVNDILDLNVLSEMPKGRKLMVTGLDDLLHKNEKVIEFVLRKIRDKKIILYPENAYYSATAIAVEYLLYNDRQGVVMSTFTGIGGKAGTEQVLLAMHTMNRYKPNMVFHKLAELRQLFEEITQVKVPDHQPIIGERIFDVESGIHVDGVLKKAANYEAYPPELVGTERRIVLGKYSGRTSIRYKLEQLGLTGEYDLAAILQLVKQMSIKKRGEITDEEFISIVDRLEH